MSFLSSNLIEINAFCLPPPPPPLFRSGNGLSHQRPLHDGPCHYCEGGEACTLQTGQPLQTGGSIQLGSLLQLLHHSKDNVTELWGWSSLAALSYGYQPSISTSEPSRGMSTWVDDQQLLSALAAGFREVLCSWEGVYTLPSALCLRIG